MLMAMARHMVIQILNQATKEAMWHSMYQEPNRFTSITTTGTINSMDMIQSLGRIPTIPLSTLPSLMLLQLIQMELVRRQQEL